MVRGVECEVSELRSAIESTNGCLLIDVREYAEYAASRIRGARLIRLGEIEDRAGEIDRSAPVYLICRTGRRSAEAQQKLLALGFKDVRNVKGGIMSWQAAGFPVECDPGAPWSLERQVRLVAGALVVAGALLGAFVAQPFIWLAGFIGAGLAYSAITDTCGMAMMLARLPWNRRADGNSSACANERAAMEEQG